MWSSDLRLNLKFMHMTDDGVLSICARIYLIVN